MVQPNQASNWLNTVAYLVILSFIAFILLNTHRIQWGAYLILHLFYKSGIHLKSFRTILLELQIRE